MVLIKVRIVYLNLVAPKENFNSPKPVLIWIHGGAFVTGTSIDLFTRPILTPLRSNIVFVSMNYRLGSFGFLYADEKRDDAPGNVGLYDQLLAIKWVDDNIGAFGGDPKQITLHGASSGSISVSLHILSPLSRNLF